MKRGQDSRRRKSCQKYIKQFEQIHFAIDLNTFHDWDECISQLNQIHYVIGTIIFHNWDKYIHLSWIWNVGKGKECNIVLEKKILTEIICQFGQMHLAIETNSIHIWEIHFSYIPVTIHQFFYLSIDLCCPT